MRRSFLPTLPTLLLAATFAPVLPAQTESGFKLPSTALAALVDAPLTPTVSLSPDKSTLLLLERSALPPLTELAQPELRLAGLRLNPAANGPSREPYTIGLVLKPLAGGAERRITGLPAGARLNHVSWSRDNRHLAFTVTLETSIELWAADTATATARRLTARPLNLTTETPGWLDAATLIVPFIPAGRGAPPPQPPVPA